MKAKSKTDDQKSLQASEELKEMIREAHALLKDFRQERKSIEELIKRTQEEWIKHTQEFVTKELDEMFESLTKMEKQAITEISEGYRKLWTELNSPIKEIPGMRLMDALKAGMERTKTDIVRGATVMGFTPPEDWFEVGPK